MDLSVDSSPFFADEESLEKSGDDVCEQSTVVSPIADMKRFDLRLDIG